MPTLDATPTPILIQTSKRLIVAGCRDPLVLYLSALFEREETGNNAIARKVFREAFAAAESLPGSKVLAWIIIRELAVSIGVSTSDSTESILKAVQLTREVLRDGSFTRSEEQIFFYEFEVSGRAKVLFRVEPFAPILDELPKGWLHDVLTGALELRLSEGDYVNGFGHRPVKERAEMWAKRISKANDVLTRAWEQHPDRPEAAALMITIAGIRDDDGGSLPRVWFDRAVAAQFDYSSAYSRMLYQLLPRQGGGVPNQGGSVTHILDFGDACREIDRMDTRVPEFYFAATTLAAKVSGDWRMIFRRPDIAKHIVQLSVARARHPSRAEFERQMHEFVSVNAFLAGDFELASTTFERLGRVLSREAREKLESFRIRDLGSELAAATGKLPPATDLDQGAGSIAGLPGQTSRIPGMGSRMELVERAAADFTAQYDSGVWVSRPSDPSDVAWCGAPWAVMIPPGAQQQPGPRVFHVAPVGESCEIRGEFTRPSRAEGSLIVRVLFADRAFSIKPPYAMPAPWGVFEIRRTAEGAYMARLCNGAGRPLVPDVPVTLNQRNEFQLRLLKDGLTAELNGARVFENVPPPFRPGHSRNQVVFGYDVSPEAAVFPVKIEMRKLPPSGEAPRPRA